MQNESNRRQLVAEAWVHLARGSCPTILGDVMEFLSFLPLFTAFLNPSHRRAFPNPNPLYTPMLRHRISTMATQYSLSSTIKLNNGIPMPRIHLGVYMTSGRETSSMVTHALEAGYRGFDSAEWYANEKEVGSAILKYIREKDVAREDIWFTTKLKDNRGYDETRRKIKDSIRKSGLGYIDLYLLHSPYGGAQKRRECWTAVEDAVAEGEVRAGGLSNFGVRHVSSFINVFFNPEDSNC